MPFCYMYFCGLGHRFAFDISEMMPGARVLVDPQRWPRFCLCIMAPDDGHGKHHIQKGMKSTGTCYFLVDNMASYYSSAHMLLIYTVE